MAKRKGTTVANLPTTLAGARKARVAAANVAAAAGVAVASVQVEDDGMSIPAFLRREPQDKAATAALIAPRQRDWVAIRGKDEITKRESLATIMAKVDSQTVNKALPVSVQVKDKKEGSNVLVKYDNWAAYEAGHDAKAYPVKRTAELDGMTVVIVTAKPWAGKGRKSSYGHDSDGTRVRMPKNDSGPATAAQRGPRAKKGDNWADSIVSACAKGATRSQVIAFLTAAYPSTDPQDFHNVMYGTLERMVKAAKLVKEKGPDGVVYRAVQ